MERKHTTFRLDARYFAGLDILVRRRLAEGYYRPNRTALLKMALDEFFKKNAVTAADIKEELEADEQHPLI